MMKIAVLGHGVVGSGVVELFDKNRNSIESKAGQEIFVQYILDIRDFADSPYAEKFTKDFNKILADDEIKVVAEVMGGLSPSYDYVKALLSAGKSVVTSNKELVAAKGAELLAVARKNNVNFFFEASVGGGIPIIRPMHQCLAANEITEVAGILNGTTNFILSKMIHNQMPFEEALAMAQSLGYAERDPSADVEGHDACRKICILASLAFGKHIYPHTVHTEGIQSLTLADVAYGESWGGVIKLIGRAKKLDSGKLVVTVYPAIVDKHSQLANIDDVFNGVLIRGNATGDVVFYGRGAGKLPTASAVVADIIDAAKSSGTSNSLTWEDTEENMVVDYKTSPLKWYIRMETADVEATKRDITEAFKDTAFLSRINQPSGEVAFVTGALTEHGLEPLLEAVNATILSKIRILDY